MEDTPFAIGANCGVGASELVAAVINMKHALQQQQVDVVIIAKANCGVPEYIGGEIVYSGTTEVMAEYVRMAVDAGARIIGGCCGTTPAHLRAMREAAGQPYQTGPFPNSLISRPSLVRYQRAPRRN